MNNARHQPTDFPKAIYEFQVITSEFSEIQNDFRSNVQGTLVLSFSPSFFNDLGPLCVVGACSLELRGGGSSSSQLFILMSL